MTSIRNLAVGLPIRNGHILAQDGHDAVKGTVYLRAIGGGIEFGETSEAALRREFREELEIELGAVQLLGVIENIFEYEGVPGHEIVHVFGVESADINSIALDSRLHVLDEGSPVGWFSISRLDRRLYPEGSAALVLAWAKQSKAKHVIVMHEPTPLKMPPSTFRLRAG